MSAMFKSCIEFEYLNLSNFDTSNVTNMEGMFFGCLKLKEIKGLNNFDISKVTNMISMFSLCPKLKY